MDQRPNYELSAEERATKLELKRLLKEQHRFHKLERRLHKARQRDDTPVIEQTVAELHAFRATSTTTNLDSLRLDKDSNEQAARNFVEQIYHQLQKTWQTPIESSPDGCIHVSDRIHRSRRNNPQYTPRAVKERRLQESQHLLRNMTKGEQSLEDFRNREALLGYTRKKFIERAGLVLTSFVNLLRIQQEQQYHQTGVDAAVIDSMLERLRIVRSVCSVGCGPGCDAVGVVAFLHSHFSTRSTTNDGCVLDRAILLDYASQHWRPILETVRDILKYQHNAVKKFDIASCDVRMSLSEQTHDIDTDEADAVLSVPNLVTLLTSTRQAESENECRILTADLVVASYLLSETRGKWQTFFDSIVEIAAPGTLFLFTDPTTWQMHLFRERYEFNSAKQRRMSFIWLYSSMVRPELQVVEGRNSPAVLLGMVTTQ